MSRLNYHHLYYFWRVAKMGNLTATAASLHLSQSALSSQIKQLEQTMDVTLFHREGRKLVLSEAGQRTLAYADDIFKKGEELEAFMNKGLEQAHQTISIGMLSTMSRNFIESFIAPLDGRPDVNFSLHARGQVNLLNGVANHQFDLALTNIEVRGTNEQRWQCQLLARQPVAIIGPPGIHLGKSFSVTYQQQRWILPVQESPIRAAFDSLCAIQQFKPNILAEADDMAMLRLLARDSGAIAVIPEVVVKDELNSGTLVHYMTLPNVFENFYAVTIKRHFQHQIIKDLLQAPLIK
jgi:LysR family transcriptional activator of nhaA